MRYDLDKGYYYLVQVLDDVSEKKRKLVTFNIGILKSNVFLYILLLSTIAVICVFEQRIQEF